MPRKLPLRDVREADLRLDEFWIERLEYAETPDQDDERWRPEVRVSRPRVLESRRSSGEYLMTLRVEASEGTEHEVRSIDLTIVGSFRFESLFEDTAAHREMPLRLLTYNGSAILFSAARGVIETVTGISGYGRMHVPSVNIAELLDR